MNEIVLIPKAESMLNVQKPCWIKNEGEILIRCICGKWCHPGNQIAEDGTLIGSFYHHWDEHPDEGCDWHVYLKLRDYKA